jgi:hypothetical protein
MVMASIAAKKTSDFVPHKRIEETKNLVEKALQNIKGCLGVNT